MRRCHNKNDEELELQGFDQWECSPEDTESRKEYIAYVDHLSEEWQDKVRLRSRVHQQEGGPPACENLKRVKNSPRTDEVIARLPEDTQAYSRTFNIRQRWLNQQPMSEEDVAYLQTNVFWRRINLSNKIFPDGTGEEYSAKYRLDGLRSGAKLSGRSWNKRTAMLAAGQEQRNGFVYKMERINRIAERPTTFIDSYPKEARYAMRRNYIQNRKPFDGTPTSA